MADYTWDIVRVRLLLAVGLVALSPPSYAGAAEPARGGLSLAGARALAWRMAPDVALARGREAVARAQVDAVGALPNPTLTVQSARLSARLTTAVSIPVPLFGQRATAVAAARSDAVAVDLDTAAVRVEARWNATHAWLDLWQGQERARLLETAAAEADRLADIARERFAAGSTARLDVVRTSADQARARAEARAARSAVAAASARLSVALGAAEGSRLMAEGAPDIGPLPSQRAALDRALSAHPALARDRAQSAAAEAHIRAEERLRWPLVSIQVALSGADPTLPGTDVIGGVSFEAPILSRRRGAIAHARAEADMAALTTEVETRRLRADLEASYELALGAAARAEALGKEVVPALEEARRMTEEGYRDGRVDLLRVLDTQRVLLEGRVAHVEAQAASQRALADLERALGARLGTPPAADLEGSTDAP